MEINILQAEKSLQQQKILILFAHPAMHRSRVNRVLIQSVRKLKNVTFRDLYEKYPDFYINVQKEQKLLLEHDVIIFMHPFYWYSTPAILKEWQDLVLEHGFAYGEGGTALQGKTLLSVITTSGTAASYQQTGKNRFTIEQLLAPIAQTAFLCGMHYHPPFITHGALHLSAAEIDEQAEQLRKTIIRLRKHTVLPDSENEDS